MMVVALLLAASAGRVVTIDGHALTLPAAADSARTSFAINVIVSAEERTLLATLLYRSWTPDDPAAEKAFPQTGVRLSGRPPDLDVERAGLQIDERLRL